jgi:hypothetical protein
MKKGLIIILLLLTTSVFSQRIKSSGVPQLVKEKFATLYPEVKNVKWEKEKANYEANFVKDKQSMSVLIDSNGNLIETETEITVSSLPSEVKNAASKKFPGSKIKEASKIIDSKGIVKYEVEVKGKDYLFDKDGNALN